jgi:hypothetical protein
MFKCVQVGISKRKHSRKPLNFYKKISKAAVMRRDWGKRFSGESEHDSRMKTCAEISKKATLEAKKEEPIPEKLEEVHTDTRTTPSIDFSKANETNKRSLSSTKPLIEFEQMDWVPIDYGEVFNKRRPIPNQKGMARALEVDFPWKSKRKIRTIFKPPVRSFESSLVKMKWIRIT